MYTQAAHYRIVQLHSDDAALSIPPVVSGERTFAHVAVWQDIYPTSIPASEHGIAPAAPYCARTVQMLAFVNRLAVVSRVEHNRFLSAAADREITIGNKVIHIGHGVIVRAITALSCSRNTPHSSFH